MNDAYFPTQPRRARSGAAYVFYSLYTVMKIACMIGVLAVDPDVSSRTLYVYIILYAATEGYELLFLALLSLHRYCFNVNTSSFLIRTGQASYEW